MLYNFSPSARAELPHELAAARIRLPHGLAAAARAGDNSEAQPINWQQLRQALPQGLSPWAKRKDDT